MNRFERKLSKRNAQQTKALEYAAKKTGVPPQVGLDFMSYYFAIVGYFLAEYPEHSFQNDFFKVRRKSRSSSLEIATIECRKKEGVQTPYQLFQFLVNGGRELVELNDLIRSYVDSLMLDDTDNETEQKLLQAKINKKQLEKKILDKR
jgi:hypothetical protein